MKEREIERKGKEIKEIIAFEGGEDSYDNNDFIRVTHNSYSRLLVN